MSDSLHTRSFSILLSDYQIRLPDFRTRRARLIGIDSARMTITDIEARLRSLVELERNELELIIRNRREAERQERLH
jgi:hypothetical protein